MTSKGQPTAVPVRHEEASLVAAADAGNPQGKGVVGFLQDWHYSSPRHVVPKSSGRLLADYFTSLLVLSSEFGFKPAYERRYHLYRWQGRWQLSLVSPDEWNRDDRRRAHVGACILHRDATWSIEPSRNLGEPGPLSDALADAYDGFMQRLDRQAPLEDELPVYEAALPYYQRLFASALSRSLRRSLDAGGQRGRPASAWLAGLPRDARKLLGDPSS